MNLTPKSWKKSEVTENKDLVKVGSLLIYSDACNFQRWEVTELDGYIATLKDAEGYEDCIDLECLQIGWDFSSRDSTKQLQLV